MNEDDLVTDKELDDESGRAEELRNSDDKERENIHVSMRYATKRFSEDSRCESCDGLADGVLLIREEESGKLKPGYDGIYCELCRAVRTKELEVSVEDFEFHKFYEDDES